MFNFKSGDNFAGVLLLVLCLSALLTFGGFASLVTGIVLFSVESTKEQFQQTAIITVVCGAIATLLGCGIGITAMFTSAASCFLCTFER